MKRGLLPAVRQGCPPASRQVCDWLPQERGPWPRPVRLTLRAHTCRHAFVICPRAPGLSLQLGQARLLVCKRKPVLQTLQLVLLCSAVQTQHTGAVATAAGCPLRHNSDARSLALTAVRASLL